MEHILPEAGKPKTGVHQTQYLLRSHLWFVDAVFSVSPHVMEKHKAATQLGE